MSHNCVEVWRNPVCYECGASGSDVLFRYRPIRYYDEEVATSTPVCPKCDDQLEAREEPFYEIILPNDPDLLKSDCCEMCGALESPKTPLLHRILSGIRTYAMVGMWEHKGDYMARASLTYCKDCEPKVAYIK